MTGRWRRFAFDAAIAAAATSVELVLLLDDGSASVAASGLTAVAGLAPLGRRRAPLAVLAAVLAAAIAIVIIGEMPSGLTVLLALYTTAATCELAVSLAALAPTAVVTTVLSLASPGGEAEAVSPGLGALSAAALTAGIWGLGAYAQTRRRYRLELEARAGRLEREREHLTRIAVHEERTAIARELHDIVAHSVTVMLVGVRGARDVLRTAPAVAERTLADVETTAERSLVELRRILAILRESSGAAESRPQPSLKELEPLIGQFRRAGLPARFVQVGRPRPLSAGVELSIHRIVQEALTNALKHARATEVIVSLAYRDEHVEVEIVDDGSGAAPLAPAGHGLVGLRERVDLLNGELEAGRRVGGGFRVAARVPVGGDA